MKYKWFLKHYYYFYVYNNNAYIRVFHNFSPITFFLLNFNSIVPFHILYFLFYIHSIFQFNRSSILFNFLNSSFSFHFSKKKIQNTKHKTKINTKIKNQIQIINPLFIFFKIQNWKWNFLFEKKHDINFQSEVDVWLLSLF